MASVLLDAGMAGLPATPCGWLLREVHDREASDLTRVARLDVVEVDSARHYLVVPVPDVPGRRAFRVDRIVLDHIDQHAARRVDADRRGVRQVDELDDLVVGRLLELARAIVRI